MIILILGAMLATAGLAYLAATATGIAASNFWGCVCKCNNLTHPSRKPYQVFTGALTAFCFSVLGFSVALMFKLLVVLVVFLDYFAH